MPDIVRSMDGGRAGARSRRCSSRSGATRRRPSSPRPRTRSPDIYDRDPLEFWADEARSRVTWFEPFRHRLRVGAAVREVVRRRQAERHLQLRRPPRRGRERRPGRLPLGGRAGGRPPRGHLRRPAARDDEARERAALARRRARGPRSGSTWGWSPRPPIAMLACARIGAPHTVVFGGFSADSLARPPERHGLRGADHPGRGLAARRDGPAQARPPTRRWRTRPACATASSCAARRRRRR